ncbi:MAG: PfkB family carbohydrate kinase [Planctomycetia bacterium]|nr:PfkB family carbohydrate kinase [Planctomycetia bacterium]
MHEHQEPQSIRYVQPDFNKHKLARALQDVYATRVDNPPRIAVVGDFCLDKYLYHYPALDEASVETGLTAYQIRATRLFPGVGGTIASNLRRLGAQVECFGVIGNDGEGYDLRRALDRIGAKHDGIVVDDALQTCAYVKPTSPISEDYDQSQLPAPEQTLWREENRIDIRNGAPIPSELIQQMQERLLCKLDQLDAIIVSDQFPSRSTAVCTAEFRQFISDLGQARPDLFILCDSRFFVNDYRNVVVKCNEREALDAVEAERAGLVRNETSNLTCSQVNQVEVLHAAETLARRNRRPVLVTKGAQGSILLKDTTDSNEVSSDAETIDAIVVPAIPVAPPIDICGAGDATNAGFAFARTLGFPLQDAAYLAGVVSSITIKQLGVTGTASVDQVLETLRKEY